MGKGRIPEVLTRLLHWPPRKHDELPFQGDPHSLSPSGGYFCNVGHEYLLTAAVSPTHKNCICHSCWTFWWLSMLRIEWFFFRSICVVLVHFTNCYFVEIKDRKEQLLLILLLATFHCHVEAIHFGQRKWWVSYPAIFAGGSVPRARAQGPIVCWIALFLFSIVWTKSNDEPLFSHFYRDKKYFHQGTRLNCHIPKLEMQKRSNKSSLVYRSVSQISNFSWQYNI